MNMRQVLSILTSYILPPPIGSVSRRDCISLGSLVVAQEPGALRKGTDWQTLECFLGDHEIVDRQIFRFQPKPVCSCRGAYVRLLCRRHHHLMLLCPLSSPGTSIRLASHRYSRSSPYLDLCSTRVTRLRLAWVVHGMGLRSKCRQFSALKRLTDRFPRCPDLLPSRAPGRSYLWRTASSCA